MLIAVCIFLELQCLVDYLVDFLELSMFINSSLNILFSWNGGLKENFVRYYLYSYFLKTVIDDLNYTCRE